MYDKHILCITFSCITYRHSNIMAEKGFKPFYEHAARCVHLLSPERTVKTTNLAA